MPEDQGDAERAARYCRSASWRTARSLADQVQPASIDLRLGEYAYPVDASFLPGEGTKVLEKMRELDCSFERFKISLRNGAVLEKGRVYVIPLLESINLRSDVAAFANPKSSTGRLDILTRLIADRATRFDQVERGLRGTALHRGRAAQLQRRGAHGHAAESAALPPHARRESQADHRRRLEVPLTAGQIADSIAMSERTGMLPFTVDLRGTGADDALIGWRAKKHARRIDLDRRDYDPLDFWEPLRFHKESCLILDPDEFYILVTKEAIAVPPEFAAEMLPYDTRAGEFRVHYAGFFDPGFGWDTATRRAGSSRGVLEVRSHEVPFLLEHGQTVGWLRYERMAERPDALYGNGGASNYQGQQLKLAKQFRPFTAA